MTVTLRDINKDNWQIAADLKVSDDQINFVRPNWFSILQVVFPEVDLFHRAIYNGDEMVGYAMMGQDPDDLSVFVGRLMIDARHQGKGYGRDAMRLILEELKARYNPSVIFIRFVPENLGAKRLYESLGFVDTGEIAHGELVYKMELK